MTYWVGSEKDIAAACKTADAKARNVPETREGKQLPREEWITERWAIPQETADPGVWAIPAFPRMHTPDGCERVDEVKWPQVKEE
ncbi:MAG: hypothetical protein U5N55_11670 [Cypionkella sp.]|nr:hypothetical protein [Cypionkella sp.]